MWHWSTQHRAKTEISSSLCKFSMPIWPFYLMPRLMCSSSATSSSFFRTHTNYKSPKHDLSNANGFLYFYIKLDFSNGTVCRKLSKLPPQAHWKCVLQLTFLWNQQKHAWTYIWLQFLGKMSAMGQLIVFLFTLRIFTGTTIDEMANKHHITIFKCLWFVIEYVPIYFPYWGSWLYSCALLLVGWLIKPSCQYGVFTGP